ncbi:MAG: gliding motility-associated C-terminal domain-containing protein [Bacteroidales bacterium]
MTSLAFFDMIRKLVYPQAVACYALYQANATRRRSGCLLVTVLFFLTLPVCNIHNSVAQNLVPNGDFELYSSLPNYYGQCSLAIGWSNVNGHYSLSLHASPDYFHTLGSVPYSLGQIAPFSGKAQMGVCTYLDHVPDFREYISTQLSSPLIPGIQYSLSFWLSSGHNGSYTFCTGNFGIHFSQGPLFQALYEPIAVTPQFEIPGIINHPNTWQQYHFLFIATNSWDHITFGNFTDDLTTLKSNGLTGAYSFIDKIELRVDQPWLEVIGDTLICYGDTARIYAYGGMNYTWTDSNHPSVIISTDSAILVSPSVTTTYLVYTLNDTASFTVKVAPPINIFLGHDTLLCEGDMLGLDASFPGATYLWHDGSVNASLLVTQPGEFWVKVTVDQCSKTDSINITMQDCDILLKMPNVFTPNNDGYNDYFIPYEMKGVEHATLTIFNRWGKTIFSTDNLPKGWDGRCGSSLCSEGTYYWTIRVDTLHEEYRTMHGVVMLLR